MGRGSAVGKHGKYPVTVGGRSDLERHAINPNRFPERSRGACSSGARTAAPAASTSLGSAPRLRSGKR
ncbi:MAG: hypothetical protein CVT74_04025 [Alphaproteobacteria bacterium HGW-Alphaproteobacteria-13]|nr:MAG: hypothetical protein CVT74_04025 [Alphaproteobacteria bacterium HGW-Alphaproteobacteria-13]